MNPSVEAYVTGSHRKKLKWRNAHTDKGLNRQNLRQTTAPVGIIFKQTKLHTDKNSYTSKSPHGKGLLHF